MRAHAVRSSSRILRRRLALSALHHIDQDDDARRLGSDPLRIRRYRIPGGLGTALDLHLPHIREPVGCCLSGNDKPAPSVQRHRCPGLMGRTSGPCEYTRCRAVLLGAPPIGLGRRLLIERALRRIFYQYFPSSQVGGSNTLSIWLKYG